jgi:hypothetical protein
MVMSSSTETSESKIKFKPANLFKHPAITHPRSFLSSIPRRTVFSNKMKEHPQGRYLVKFATILGHPFQYALRKSQAFPLKTRTGYQVDAVNGYCKLHCGELPGFTKVLDLCRNIFQERLPQFELIAANQATGKDYMADMLYDQDLRDHPEIIDFALQDAFLAMASDYLGGVPVLRRVTMFYSNHRNYDDLIRSQLFHVDGEDIKQLKFFINLYDVQDEQDGPFTFMPAKPTAEFLKHYRKTHGALPESNRYRDEEVFADYSPAQLIRGLGKTGEGLAVDTSRCLHYGSRIASGHFRLILFMQYVSYHNIAECKLNTIESHRFPENSPQRLALTPRISHPFAYYYTNPLLSGKKDKS